LESPDGSGLVSKAVVDGVTRDLQEERGEVTHPNPLAHADERAPPHALEAASDG